MRKPKLPTKLTTRQVAEITGRSPGRLSQLIEELPPLRERVMRRGGGKLYDRDQVLAWAKKNPPNETKQRAGRARAITQA